MILLEKSAIKSLRVVLSFIIVIVLLIALWGVASYNFLLFHVIAELFSIIIAYSIFLITWNSRHFNQNNFLAVLSVAFFFIGTLDLVHTLGYYGMNLFKGYGANLPTQLWISARYLESLSLFIICLLRKPVKNMSLVFFIYSFIFITLLLSIFTGQFPECYIDGMGLTFFKKASEYIISGILLVSVLILVTKRKDIDITVRKWLIISLVLTIVSEMMFTFYISVYGISNLIGHYLKIISFYFIYKALIETSLKQPYTSLFNELYKHNLKIKENEKKLTVALQEKEMLLKEVYHRTKNNLAVISGILNLQCGKLDDSKLVDVFKDASLRIELMALVQEKLYKSCDMHSISLSEYINDLGRYIERTYLNGSKDIKLNLNMEPLIVETNTAVSIGFIINELLSNAYKYAFNGINDGEIKITLKTLKTGEIELSLIDSGVGLPADFEERKNTSLGLQLVNMTISDQLDGTLEIKKDNGTGYYILFNLESP